MKKSVIAIIPPAFRANLESLYQKAINFCKSVISKFNSLSFLKKIIFFYILFAIPFLYYHENHLPILIILLLILAALIVSMILFLVTIFILKLLFQKEFRPSFEIVYVALFLTLIYFVGFLDNAGGGLFLAFILGISLFYRLIKSVVYFRITLIGMAILLNGLLTFKFLQSAEIFLLYQSTRNRYEMKEINLNHWKYDEKARRLSNEDIPLYLTLPEGSYFFKPDDLDLKEKTGTGQVAGIVSVSDTNPNLYPYVRLFLIPAYVTVDIDTIRSEISSLIDVAVHRGEMNEIKPIGDQKLLSKKWPGYFWIFYDIIRPRYAKTGFYLMTLKSGDRILIHMMENIVKGQFHEKEIIELLESISEDPQSKN